MIIAIIDVPAFTGVFAPLLRKAKMCENTFSALSEFIQFEFPGSIFSLSRKARVSPSSDLVTFSIPLSRYISPYTSCSAPTENLIAKSRATAKIKIYIFFIFRQI